MLPSRYVVPITVFTLLFGLSVLYHNKVAKTAVCQAVSARDDEWRVQMRQAKQDSAYDAHQKWVSLSITNMELFYELQSAKKNVADSRAAVTAARNGLQYELDRIRGREITAPEGTPAFDRSHEARALANSLSECSKQLEEVAGTADDLSIQVTGLQDYLNRVVRPAVVFEELPGPEAPPDGEPTRTLP